MVILLSLLLSNTNFCNTKCSIWDQNRGCWIRNYCFLSLNHWKSHKSRCNVCVAIAVPYHPQNLSPMYIKQQKIVWIECWGWNGATGSETASKSDGNASIGSEISPESEKILILISGWIALQLLPWSTYYHCWIPKINFAILNAQFWIKNRGCWISKSALWWPIYPFKNHPTFVVVHKK